MFLNFFSVIVGVEIDLARGALEIAVDGERMLDRIAFIFKLNPVVPLFF